MTPPGFYWILGPDGEAIPFEGSTDEWGRWFENFANRAVANDQVGRYQVSTVFLGLDHRWGVGPPLLFETMVFGPDDDDGGLDERWCKRHATRAEAFAHHERVVEALRADWLPGRTTE